MRNDSTPRGRFLWYELLTTEPQGAVDFYTRVAGWDASEISVLGAPYTMWSNAGLPLGGLMRLPDDAAAGGVPPNWLPYIGTPDVDETAALAEELGGRVMVQPTDIPDVGRFAVLADPQGAVFAIYTPAGDTPPAAETPRPGEFSWHELVTTDRGEAFRFYQRLFGWDEADAFEMAPGDVYQMYGAGGRTLGGIYNRPPEMPVPPNWLCYIHVDDADRAAERVAALGGRVLNGPMEVPGGDRIAQCLDPQGAAFAVHSAPRL